MKKLLPILFFFALSNSSYAQPVVLNCPTNTTTPACQSSSAVLNAFNAWLNSASAGGGCNGVLTNNSAGTPPDACGGAKIVTFTYTSTCAPFTSTCQATFTVAAAPTVILTCPINTTEAANQTQAAVNSAFSTWLASVSGTGGCNGVLTNDNTGAPNACGGATTVMFTYTSTCAPFTTTCQSTFSVPPLAPTGISGTTAITIGSSTTLSVVGGVQGGATVEWFAGSCGSTVIGTGPSITVSPTTNTTYFVRYRGTCSSTTTCASVNVTVTMVSSYNNAARNDFYGIGGYSFTEGYIPNGNHPSPYVRSGPSPQNDFMYVATTPDGSDLYGSYGELSTHTTNSPITLTFKGNNVRKMGLNVYEVDINEAYSSGSIVATITTNLNNTASLTSTSGARFVGFRVINENEYIVSATFSSNSGFYTSLKDLMIGDDTPQNVALNFDGVNDYVSIPSTVGYFATNDDFTVSCWIKPDLNQSSPNGQFYANENDIITKRFDASGSVSNPYPFEIRYLNNNRTTVSERNKIRAGQWDGTNFSFITSTTQLNDGKWHHVAFVRESGNFKLYIDGVQEGGTVADNATGTTTNASALQIGRRANNQNFFKGEIDEVRIWNIAKTATEVADERFCKTPNSTNLQASYNFSNGVPHDNNTLITQVQDAVSTNHGTLNNFVKTGDVSNFVTGQVKYVKNDAIGSNNGSSWTNAFSSLQSALPSNTCNDLFDVYVAVGTYKPAVSGVGASFVIPTGMSIYGGFAGTEKSINQRNRALILTTNETTLSGDLGSNDNLSNFTQNRTDNSKTVVNIASKSNIILDGFSIRGGNNPTADGGGISATNSENIQINHCKIFDNLASSGGGIGAFSTTNLLISNTYLLGNLSISIGNAIYFYTGNGGEMKLHNTVVAGHTGVAINFTANGGTTNHSCTNCTFANNGTAIRNGVVTSSTTINFTLTNSIMYGNTAGIDVFNNEGTYNQNITYSLVQGVTTGTGNLNGNTTNPQFVNLPTTRPSTAGDYRLKWCSRAIGAGDNAGISPLDLDRNPRNFNGTADMGAFEFLGNTPSQVNNSSITGTIDSPTYAGGAIQTITSTAKILAPAGAIDFKAPNSITLNPGFEARGVGQYFKAQIGANVACSN